MSKPKFESGEFAMKVGDFFTSKGDSIESKTDPASIIFYGLKMFWLNRPDKIYDGDLSLYIWLTNSIFYNELKKPLSLNHKPSSNNESIFNQGISFSDLEAKFMLVYEEEMTEKPAQSESRWHHFFRFWK